MDDMVERVAKAMAENNDFCWDYCDKPTWLRDARLALELSGVAEMLAALTKLANEAAGWRVEALAEVGGWTNARCLMLRVEEARAAIAQGRPRTRGQQVTARITPDERRRLRNQQRRVMRARLNSFNWTDPASRHLHIMAEALAQGGPYPMIDEEPGHCAETMLAVLESLWKLRAKVGGP